VERLSVSTGEFPGEAMSYLPPNNITQPLQDANKPPVRVCSTDSVNLGGTLTTVDGVSLNDEDRVLLRNQSVPAENGIYVWSSGTQLLTRSRDGQRFDSGVIISVQEGSVHASRKFHLTTVNPIVVGTTALTFAFFGTTEATLSWAFQTNVTGSEYAGGFYNFNSGSNDFSPATNFGIANASVAAHVSFITGAVAVGAITVRVTGTSINDFGVRVASDTEDVVIPDTTPANSYFETDKKWNGQVSIETIAGTAIQCNYGFSKYYDFNNRDFDLVGLEALWSSDSNDSTSDIELIHHRSTGWTFNGGGEPTLPAAIVSRSGDHGAENDNVIGQGAWKRTNLTTFIQGADSEGVLWKVTSGASSPGNTSFRILSLELTICRVI
jgi:hypothetical protein